MMPARLIHPRSEIRQRHEFVRRDPSQILPQNQRVNVVRALVRFHCSRFIMWRIIG